ncbi:MAG: lipopolysaccharide transport periplasmic protein LptA [Desulfobulbaceae bacterium]|nr:lipopolysaccharide transport periplasmic protein LptA [Desulfobulbaceae bacterium]
MKKPTARSRRLIATSLFILMGLLPLPAAAEQPAAKTSAQPIHIEADRMESFERKNEVLFTGRVEAKQGDIVMYADNMTVYYAQSDAKGKAAAAQSQRVEKLIAKGNVKIVSSAGWVATGKTVDYFATERKAILIGDAKVWQDNNMVTGDKIILYLDEGKSIVERSPQQKGERVKAFIYPEDEKAASGANGKPRGK